MKKKKNSQSGFVILFAVIISAIIMVIGAGIFSIAEKETILASTVAESLVGIFAADTGMECALYHEYVEKPNGWPDPQSNPNSEFSCGVDDSIVEKDIEAAVDSDAYGYEFEFMIAGTPSCGKVVVQRNVDTAGGLLGVAETGSGTRIISRGYNVCIIDNGDILADTSSPSLIERRLEAWYPNPEALIAEQEAETGGAGDDGF